LQKKEIEEGKQLLNTREQQLKERENNILTKNNTLEKEYQLKLKLQEEELKKNQEHQQKIELKLKQMEELLKKGEMTTEAERALADSEEKLKAMEEATQTAKQTKGKHFFPDDEEVILYDIMIYMNFR
jgi:hypothetical protein